MKISIRQTQKGDWLVFEAIPATLGVGVDQVGSPAGGYTTGLQFQHFGTEEEAENYAGALAAKTNAELVEWQPPQRKNVRFGDLPRLYPDRIDYETREQAEADGWVRINPSKTITHYRGVKIYCADVTPGNSFGYELAIKAMDREFAHSTQIGIGRYFSIRFRTGEVLDAIEAARKFIDHDLITQAEAVKEGAPSIQAVNNAIREGYLTGYRDSGNNPHRPGGQLISRTEVRKRWNRNPKGEIMVTERNVYKVGSFNYCGVPGEVNLRIRLPENYPFQTVRVETQNSPEFRVLGVSDPNGNKLEGCLETTASHAPWRYQTGKI